MRGTSQWSPAHYPRVACFDCGKRVRFTNTLNGGGAERCSPCHERAAQLHQRQVRERLDDQDHPTLFPHATPHP